MTRRAAHFLVRHLGLLALIWASPVAASTLTPIYTYPGANDGQSPQASLIDVGGTLYGVAAAGGNWLNGTIFKVDPATGAETTIYSFTGGADGAAPAGGLIAVGGLLYGTTSAGGASGNGVVFSFDPATARQTTLHGFAGGARGAHPYCALLHLKGVLYGTTYGSSDGTGGTIFSYDLATARYTTLYTAIPFFAYSGVIAMGGLLYGTDDDSVFSFDPATLSYKTLYRFTGNLDGSGAYGGLLALNGTLYGTTRNGGSTDCGVVYAIDPTTGAETTLYSFTGGQDGEWPLAALIEIGGSLYGTTSNWGADYSGTIFKVDPRTGAETTLYAIQYETQGFGPSGALLNRDGTLYATVTSSGPANDGSLVAVNLATRAGTTLHQFEGRVDHVNSALTSAGGALYGVSSQGGPADQGIIVRIDPATGASAIAYAFTGGADGGSPTGAPIADGPSLYGTTQSGGTGKSGTVFRFDRKTAAETPLHAFSGGADGAAPDSALLNIAGTLYGTTPYGGTNDNGTLFRLNPASGAEATLFSFGLLDSYYNDLYAASKLLEVGGVLYGTLHGLFYSTGIVYAFDMHTGSGKVLHAFSADGAKDGRYPDANLIESGGALYGTTVQGGPSGYGTVFKMNRRTGAETVLYSFAGGADGAFPSAALVNLNGLLYGTASQGGASGDGTLFSIDPATGAKTTLYSFTGGADGSMPAASLIAIDGVLYGTTNRGAANNRGTAFRFTP